MIFHRLPHLGRYLPHYTAITCAMLSLASGVTLAAGPQLPPASPTNFPSAGSHLIQVGPTRAIRTIAEAARTARSNDVIEIDAGDYIGDVAVWSQDNLTLRGVGGMVNVIAGGLDVQGKGTWVVRGGTVTIENISFSGARVKDKNGAGIRFEKGDLTIRNCRFEDNQNGILTAGGDSTLTIEDSEFARNGSGDGRTHQLYVGDIKRLVVKGSYFHHSKVGHLIKSRAAENIIAYNRLTDELGGTASYELEFPNGGINYVIGNIIEQSSSTDNSNIIAVGKEGWGWPRNELYLINNTIADDRPSEGVFLSVQPGLHVLRGYNNVLIGRGHSETGSGPAFGKAASADLRSVARQLRASAKSLLASAEAAAPEAPAKNAAAHTDVKFENNLNVDWDQFVLAARYDYRPAKGAKLLAKYVDPGTANGMKLAPDRQYKHPHSTQLLSAAPVYAGALQEMK